MGKSTYRSSSKSILCSTSCSYYSTFNFSNSRYFLLNFLLISSLIADQFLFVESNANGERTSELKSVDEIKVTSSIKNYEYDEKDLEKANENRVKVGGESALLLPTVLIVTLVRNKAHTLPYFLTLLEQLDYPKDRISIWMRSDHNEDDTPDILRQWSRRVDNSGRYHSVSVEIVDSPPYRHSDQKSTPVEWSAKRFRHLIRLKQEALRVARKIWADYIWFLDADALIVNNKTLKHLVSKSKDCVAPMLVSGSMYSNFWGGMSNYYYVRTDEYKEILDHKKTGCFSVPMVHSAVLINMRKRNAPNFIPVNDTIPEDDIILLATNANSKGVPMEICNDLDYGALMSPLDEKTELMQDLDQLTNLRVEIAAYWAPPPVPSPDFRRWIPQPTQSSTLGFDNVYLINLRRRPDRLSKMQNALQILGIHYELIEATDGNDLTPETLKEMGINQLPDYKDPYSKRVMTYGEIGCFLSHYSVWQNMLRNYENTALILEDDIRFEPYFAFHLRRVFQQAADLNLDWDLMYLGRKRSTNANEPHVAGSELIVHVDYSYWTLGYAITSRGVKKLIDADPFKKLVPIDEFLPIMFDRHINKEWMAAYPTRNLKAFSAEPLLLFPTHYTGEPGYISDTEQSGQIITTTNCTTKDEL